MATTKRMTQTQLIRSLAEAEEGMTNKQARAVLGKLTELAISETKKNGLFVLPGIGRLVRVDRKARMGRNPATGEAIKIAAKTAAGMQDAWQTYCKDYDAGGVLATIEPP